MDDQEILKRVIDKATRNDDALLPSWNSGDDEMKLSACKNFIATSSYQAIIFSHKFMQAFFGDEWQALGCEMLMTENPLRFLQKFLWEEQPQP